MSSKRVGGNAISVVTLFPELVQAVGGCGVTGRALDNNLLTLSTVNPRDFTTDRHRTVDDRPYGGGPGMVMLALPLDEAITQAQACNAEQVEDSPVVVHVSPQGEQLDHGLVEELADCRNLVLVAGRYEGIDERLIQSRIDREISIGDYVLSGGELAAMVIVDAVARHLPGVLGHEDSARQDSFAGSGLLDCPHYSRPEDYKGMQVPEVLLGGNHAKIRAWRHQQALLRTWQRRPEIVSSLLEEQKLTVEDRQFLMKIKEAEKHRPVENLPGATE